MHSILYFLIIFLIPISSYSNYYELPARVGGKLFINGNQISRINDDGYIIEVTKNNNQPYFLPAIDNDGMNRYDFYNLNIPFKSESSHDNKARWASMLLN